MSDNVKIDKYVLVTEKSPKVIVFDNSIQRNIVSVNTLSDEHNLALAEMILAELNTGKYEAVEDDSGNTGDIINSDNGGLHTGDNSNNDGVTPINESEGNDGAVEPDVIGDTGNGDDTTLNDEDLNNG